MILVFWLGLKGEIKFFVVVCVFMRLVFVVICFINVWWIWVLILVMWVCIVLVCDLVFRFRFMEGFVGV